MGDGKGAALYLLGRFHACSNGGAGCPLPSWGWLLLQSFTLYPFALSSLFCPSRLTRPFPSR